MLLIDAHVHIYSCFNLETLLDAVLDNFKNAAEKFNKGAKFQAMLLLAETRGENSFERLSDLARSQQKVNRSECGSWSFHLTEEESSLFISREDDQGFFVIAGRQLTTKEKLEVLALASISDRHDGLPLDKTLQMVQESGAIPVIPWGVGKWTGRRGVILQNLLKHSSNQKFFLGDNGGRPVIWPAPSLFKFAVRQGIRTLPGSDPLPIPNEYLRVGSFGLILHAAVSQDRPTEDIKNLFLSSDVPFKPYGRLLKTSDSIRNQMLLRIRHHQVCL